MKRPAYLLMVFVLANMALTANANPLTTWTDAFDTILKAHVKPGVKSGITANLVDYKTISKDSAFFTLYDDLKALPDISNQPSKVQLAFWINAYNYLTIYKVASKPEIKKLTDLNTLFKNVWKQPAGSISGKSFTLDQIEHEIIRKQFKEPRIHVALVCAAVSCPDLRAEAFRATTLDAQLDEQMTLFLNNNKKGERIDHQEKEIYLSSIFDWYGGDFTGGIVPWLVQKKYLPAAAKTYDVEFFSYNWELNSKN